MTIIKSAFKIFDKISDIFLMSCLSAMGCVLFIQVISRYVFKSPLIWSEELARYLNIWITLFGIRFALKHDAHLRVSFFFNRFNRKIQHCIQLTTNIFIVVCIILYIPGAIIFVEDQAQIVSSAMGVNMGIVYMPVVLGYISAIFYLLNECFKTAMKLFFSNEEHSADTSMEVV